MFFLAFFAKKMNFNHSILIPANISILPIYILHQTLIIVIGFYVVDMELNMLLKFTIITLTAIPSAVLLYKLIQTNNVSRFLFGMKKKAPKKPLVSYSTFVNSQKVQLQPIVPSTPNSKHNKNEII